jgi:predicted nucleic acid-binding protein
MIVLDTNVLSELIRREPSQRVERWIAAQPVASLFITTITQSELLHGVALLPLGKRRSAIAEAVEAMFAEDFAERILPFDTAAARAFAPLAVERRQAGRPIAQLEAQIAAIARSRSASVATRNMADFDGCGIALHNPWHA